MRGMSFGLGPIFIEPVLSYEKLKDVLLNQLNSNLDLKSQVKNCSFSAGFYSDTVSLFEEICELLVTGVAIILISM